MEINEVFKKHREQQNHRIVHSMSNYGEVEESFQKGQESDQLKQNGSEDEDENPFNKAAEEADSNIEKSDLLHALDYGNNLKFSKSGKEIKEQVQNVLLPELNAKLQVKKAEADAALQHTGAAPTKEVSTWWTGDIKMDVGYKVYDWEETCCKTNDNSMVASLSATQAEAVKGNCPVNDAEAVARREYNDKVRCVCEVLVDLKACEILNNLNDGTEYELTPRQLVIFKFS